MNSNKPKDYDHELAKHLIKCDSCWKGDNELEWSTGICNKQFPSCPHYNKPCSIND